MESLEASLEPLVCRPSRVVFPLLQLELHLVTVISYSRILLFIFRLKIFMNIVSNMSMNIQVDVIPVHFQAPLPERLAQMVPLESLFLGRGVEDDTRATLVLDGAV